MIKARGFRMFILVYWMCMTSGTLFVHAVALPGSPLVPAILTGTVTNAITGAPVVGAKIEVNGLVTWSVAGGHYTLEIDPVGTFSVIIKKTGFDLFTSAPIAFQAGIQTNLPVTIWENLNPPSNALAWLDTVQQTVHIDWGLPKGKYDVLYDDGIQDGFTVWAFQGNMHAVRFTPAAWPVRVEGGMVHLGKAGNYPSGTLPLVPFQIAVYDALGLGGMPGNVIAGPFDVIPTAFGWNTFTFPASVEVPAGDFYLVMIQGGNAPTAAGIGIDQSSFLSRSVARFATGGGPWIPANGNFMLRAYVYGAGGPLDADDGPESLLNYEVYRLRQGEEQNVSVWTPLGTTTDLFADDSSWQNLPCGPYRWGIRSAYSNNRFSPAAFSNVLGKCWTVSVAVHVELSCPEASPEGTFVRLKNLVYPDTLYGRIVDDTSGTVIFPAVWKGTYEVLVEKFAYTPNTQSVSFIQNTTMEVMLLQKKPPPRNLSVNEKSLVTQWDIPAYEDTVFQENWTSGNFQQQGWTTAGGTNWIISTVIGNPAPSTMFSWSPQIQNYEQTLTSKPIGASHSAILTLSYDVYLDNFSTTTVNQMAVEIWDGTAWTLLKNFSNACGSIPWSNHQQDISSFTNNGIRIRFKAYGEDTYDINNWNIDNIRVVAAESAIGLTNCILGYNVYLDNVLSGFTTDTKYSIPGSQVQYGQSYNVCVLAAYGSGYSPKICEPFTSGFLYPPRSLTGTPVENAVYLQWLKPKKADSTTPQGITGYRLYRNGILIKSLNGPDSLSYYDTGLEPGIYQYEVSAWYDLYTYGFPGEFDESMKAGPVTVLLNYGRTLPFYEPWDQASFAYNDWRFYPDQGNWTMDVGQGIPAPAARFSGEPDLAGYSRSLESPVLDATPYECSRIWLDADIRLDDLNASGTEKLVVEVYYSNVWHKMTEYTNTGSVNWTGKHIDISPVAGQAFRVRFRATGTNSSRIIGWMVDNIRIYPVCYPAENLQGDVMGYTVLLTWSPPRCEGSGGILDEGFESMGFPPSGWDRIITNPVATWDHVPATAALGVHSGNFSAGLLWEYAHQDEWLIVRDILVTGNLTFWSHAYQGSVHNDHYYVKLSPDGGSSWEILLDLSEMPVYPGFNGYNDWETPYEVDLSAFTGQTVDLAWQAVDEDGQGLWYSWAIDDCSVGTDAITTITYDVYRQPGGTGDYEKVNGTPVPDTTYADEGLPPQEYAYFVVALSSECTLSETSDTIAVDVITSINTPVLQPDEVTIFPNPAKDKVHISSTAPIVHVTLFDVYGRRIELPSFSPCTNLTIPVSGLITGTYLIMIQTFTELKYSKVLLLP